MAKQAKKQVELGTAKEQNAAYAKIAKKFSVGATVQELNGLKRQGVISVSSKPGSAFVDVNFGDEAPILTKHIGDLKLVKQDKPAKKASSKVSKKSDKKSTAENLLGLIQTAVLEEAEEEQAATKAFAFPTSQSVEKARVEQAAEVATAKEIAKKQRKQPAPNKAQIKALAKFGFKFGDKVAGIDVPTKLLGNILWTPLADLTHAVNPCVRVSQDLDYTVSPLEFLVKYKKPKFATGAWVTHVQHGVGEVKDVSPDGSVFNVKFVSYATAMDVPGKELKVNTKKAVPEFHRFDRVQELYRLLRTGVVTSVETEGVFVQFDGKAESELVNPASIELVKPKKVKFEDVNLFGAFVFRNRNFVKISKSNGIACVIEGSTDEPFAMLATATSKIRGDAVQRFKKADKVNPYEGPVASSPARKSAGHRRDPNIVI